jgi:hypothetical protein
MGAEFLEVQYQEEGSGTGGYAKVMSEGYQNAQWELFARQAMEVDVIITTALIPGRPAPKLITAGMVETMKRGSVIVDLAAEQGGNCELTVPGEAVVRHGVTIIGYTDLPSRLARQASTMYATNLLRLLEELCPKKDGSLDVNMEDEVIRGTTVSAEHVSAEDDALNLKDFIYTLDAPVIVGGVATYRAALHLMRAGAAGVLVGFGGGASHTTADVLGVRVPMATSVADVSAARRDYMDESGGRYVHVIADGAMGRSGDIVKAIACGADAVMVGSPLARAAEAPGRGWHWGMEAVHAELPRGERHWTGTVGSLEQVMHGPSRVPDGTMNLVGALRRAMATSGYSDLKEFQRVDVTVSPGR